MNREKQPTLRILKGQEDKIVFKKLGADGEELRFSSPPRPIPLSETDWPVMRPWKPVLATSLNEGTVQLANLDPLDQLEAHDSILDRW